MQKITIKKLFLIFIFAIIPTIVVNCVVPIITTHVQENTDLEVECSICFGDFDPSFMVGFSCNHTICADCMKAHMEAFKKDRNGGLLCPERSCRKGISEEDIDVYLTKWEFVFDTSTVSEHMRILREQKAEAAKQASIAHLDAESQKLVDQSTSPCPNCKYRIEKNGGCNHMTCKKCRHEFCWVCMGNWQGHGGSYFQCNRPVVTQVQPAARVPIQARINEGPRNYWEDYDYNRQAPVHTQPAAQTSYQREYWEPFDHDWERFSEGVFELERRLNFRSSDPVVLGVAGAGCAAVIIGAGIAYKAHQTSRKPISQLIDSELPKDEKKSWLGKKSETAKCNIASFGTHLKNKLASKKSNWPAMAIKTGVALEVFAGLTAADLYLSTSINQYLRNKYHINPDLYRPINIAVSLGIASMIQPLFRLFAKNNTLDLLAADTDFIRLVKAANVEEIALAQEQIVEYIAKVAAINPDDISRLELRKKFDLSISTIDDLDAKLRIALIYVKAKELNGLSVNSLTTDKIKDTVKRLKDILQELPITPISDAIEKFLYKVEEKLIGRTVKTVE